MRKCEFCESYITDDTLTNCENCGAALPKPGKKYVRATPEEQAEMRRKAEQNVYTRLSRIGLILSAAAAALMSLNALMGIVSDGVAEFFTVMSVTQIMPMSLAIAGVILSVIASKKEHEGRQLHMIGMIMGAVVFVLYIVFFIGCIASFGQLAGASVLDCRVR